MQDKIFRMDKDELGSEVQLNFYESVCFFMGCKIKENDEQARELDELCRYLAAERCSFDPHKNMFVGVFLSCNKWARGEIKEIYERAAFSEYKVFLIDQGSFLTVKKSFLVPLNESVKYPPQHMRMGLYGVVPNLTMSKKNELILADLLHEGPVYFREKKLIKGTAFGNIFIKSPSKSAIIDLTDVLLKRRLVRKVMNFEEEIIPFLNAFEENQPYFTRKTSAIDKVKDKDEGEKHTLKEKRQTVSPSKTTRSSGYFSSDEESNRPCAHEDAIFLPAGMQYPSTKISNKKSKDREPIKMPRTHFEILRDKSKSAEHRSRSRSKYSLEKDSVTPQSYTTEIQKDHFKENESRYVNLARKPHLITNQPVFESKHITWGNDSYTHTSVKISDNQPKQKKSRAFNLNFNSEENRRNETTENKNIYNVGSIKTEAVSVNIEDKISQAHKPENIVDNILPGTKDGNIITKENNSSSSDNSITCSHVPTLTLPKTQRLKLKYKAGRKSTANIQLDQIKFKPECKTTEASDSFQSTEINHPHLDNSNTFNFIQQQYVNNKMEQLKERCENELITEIVSSQGEGNYCEEMKNQLACNSKAYELSNSKSIRKLPMRERYKKLKDTTCAGHVDVCYKISDDPQKLTASLNSLGRETFNDHFSKKVEIIKKMHEKMAPTEEQLRNQSQDYSTETRFIPQSGIMCINKSTGVLVHSHDNKIVPPVTSLSDSGLDIHIIKANQDH